MTKLTRGMLVTLVMFGMFGCSGTKTVLLQEQQRRIVDLNERALQQALSGHQGEADTLLQQALRLADSLDDRETEVLTLLNQSRLARHAGKQQAAFSAVEQALARAKGSEQYADAAQERALLELSTGKLDTAASWAEAARTAESGDNLGRRLNLLARITLLQGKQQEAAQLAEKALDANRKAGQELEQANTLRLLGSIRARERAFEKAAELLEKALQLDKQEAEPRKIAEDLDALAELAGLQQDTSRQAAYRERATRVRESLKPPAPARQ